MIDKDLQLNNVCKSLFVNSALAQLKERNL